MKKEVRLVYFLIILFTLAKFNLAIAQSNDSVTEAMVQNLINKAEVIIEGKVLSEKGFYGPEKKIIYTAFEVEVYKVFKGQTSEKIVEFIKVGGAVGDMAMTTSHGEVGASVHSIGLFFGVKSEINNSYTKVPNEAKYQFLYGNLGYVDYLPYKLGTASDLPPLRVKNIASELYPTIQSHINQVYKEVIPFDVTTWTGIKERQAIRDKSRNLQKKRKKQSVKKTAKRPQKALIKH